MKKYKFIVMLVCMFCIIGSLEKNAFAEGLITQDLNSSYIGEEKSYATFSIDTQGTVRRILWYLDEDMIFGANDKSCTIELLNEYNGGYIHCVVEGELNGQVISSESGKCRIVVTKNGQMSNQSYTQTVTSKPEITKHPTGETVNEGEYAIFISTADGADSFVWRIVSPDTKNTVIAKEAGMYFSGVQVEGFDTERLILRYIPAELDGWAVECKFSNSYGDSFSNGARIHVNKSQPTVTPAPTPTAPSSQSENKVNNNVNSTGGNNDDYNIIHKHIAKASKWLVDADSHWHECECGEIFDKQNHSVEWTVVTEPNKRSDGIEIGICKECDYQKTRIVSFNEKEAENENNKFPVETISILVILLFAIGAVTVFLVKQLKHYK